MGKKRKHLFSTWSDAEVGYKDAAKRETVLDIALREMIIGKVHWLEGEQPRKVGLCKLGAAHGGVVILVERERIDAKYLDEWAGEVQRWEAPPTSKTYMPEYKAWLDIRRLATAAKTEQAKAQDKAAEERKGCQRTAPLGVVDQDVRQY